jgi:hypothetical protein
VIRTFERPFDKTFGTVFGKGEAAFLPSHLPNLLAWYRKGVGVTVTGSGVSQWDDQSGNDNHMLQAVDAARPAYNLSTKIITFNGVHFLKTATIAALVQPISLYLRVSQIGYTLGDRFYDGDTANSGSLHQRTTTPEITAYAGIFGNPNSDLTISVTQPVVVITNGVNSLIQVNTNTPTTGDTGVLDMSGWTLGARGDGTGGFIVGTVEEAYVYAPVAHNSSQIAKNVAYLAAL